MHVISKARLREFWQKHASAEKPLDEWYRIVKLSDFENFAQLRATFNSVDKVGDAYVFNIGGNHYRLVTRIRFHLKKVFIVSVHTHADYDKERIS